MNKKLNVMYITLVAFALPGVLAQAFPSVLSALKTAVYTVSSAMGWKQLTAYLVVYFITSTALAAVPIQYILKKK